MNLEELKLSSVRDTIINLVALKPVLSNLKSLYFNSIEFTSNTEDPISLPHFPNLIHLSMRESQIDVAVLEWFLSPIANRLERYLSLLLLITFNSLNLSNMIIMEENSPIFPFANLTNLRKLSISIECSEFIIEQLFRLFPLCSNLTEVSLHIHDKVKKYKNFTEFSQNFIGYLSVPIRDKCEVKEIGNRKSFRRFVYGFEWLVEIKFINNVGAWC